MKKVFAIVSFILSLCFLLTGCGQSAISPNATQSPKPVPTATPQSKELFMLPDWVTFGMSENDVRSHYALIKNHTTVSNVLLYAYPYKDYNPNDFIYEEHYSFSRDKLYAVALMATFDPSISFNAEASAKKPIVEEYNYIKSILTTKFGKPSSDKVTWEDNTYKKDPSKLTYAIARGDCVYKAVWYYNDYRIQLYNGRLSIYVDYMLISDTK